MQGRQVANVAKGLAAPLVPAVGDTVIGRVTRIQPRACIVDILCVGNSKLKTSFQGIIRIQDVRDFAGEQVRSYRHHSMLSFKLDW
jgi:exosome complex RNA-binding protein Csl4